MSAARHHKSRPITADRAITWTPLDDGFYLLASVLSSMRAAPIAIMQDVLLRVASHIRSADPGVACGVLCGNSYFDPESQNEYLLVEQAVSGMRVDHSAEEDAAVVAAVRRAAASAEGAGQRVFGWYRGGATLRPHQLLADTASYHAIFPHRWQVGLLHGGDSANPRGAVVRIDPAEARAYSIPFVECALAPRRENQPFATALRWKNYFTEVPVEPLADPAPGAAGAASAQPKKHGLFTGLFHRPHAPESRRGSEPSISIRRPTLADRGLPSAPAQPPVPEAPAPAAATGHSASRPEAPEAAGAGERRGESQIPVELERLFLPPPTVGHTGTPPAASAVPDQLVTAAEPQGAPVPPPMPPPAARPDTPAAQPVVPAGRELQRAQEVPGRLPMSETSKQEAPPERPGEPESPSEQLPDTHEHLVDRSRTVADPVLSQLRQLAHPERLEGTASRRGRGGVFGHLGAWPAIAAVALLAIGFALWQRGALHGDRLVIRGGQLDPGAFNDESGGGTAGVRTGQAATLTPDQLGRAQFALARMGAYGDDLSATLDAIDSTLRADSTARPGAARCHSADSLLRQTTLQADLLAQARRQVADVVGASRQDWADALAARARGASFRVHGVCP